MDLFPGLEMSSGGCLSGGGGGAEADVLGGAVLLDQIIQLQENTHDCFCLDFFLAII